MQTYEFDTVILGGGPAGLAAATYASRGAVSTALIDISMMGGQPSNYLELENYPGFPVIGGYDLMEKFEEHADKFGVQKFPMQEIEKIDLVSMPKIILTKEAEFRAKTVIIATGAQPMKLGVPGEKEFVGRGVSYCAVCDGAFYKDKTVAVVGGGNSAVEEAMYLTKFANKVYIIHRRGELRADKIVQERAFKNEKIEFVWNSIVKEIQGDDLVHSAVLENVKTNEISNLAVNGVFPYIGIVPNVEHISGQVEQDAGGFIITDETMKTSVVPKYDEQAKHNSCTIPSDEQIYKEPDAILKILNNMAHTVGLVFIDAGKESMLLPLKKARYIEDNLYEIEILNPYYGGRKKVIEIAIDYICMKKDMTYTLHSVTFSFDEKPVPLFSRISDGLGNGYKRIRLNTNYLIKMVKLSV